MARGKGKKKGTSLRGWLIGVGVMGGLLLLGRAASGRSEPAPQTALPQYSGAPPTTGGGGSSSSSSSRPSSGSGTTTSRSAKPPAGTPVIYSAVKLDDSSRKKLLDWWGGQVYALLPFKGATHLPIQNLPSDAEVRGLPLGQEVEIRITGVTAPDPKVQAVFASVVGDTLPEPDGVPRIIVSTASGASPADINAALAKGSVSLQSLRLETPAPTLRGKVMLFLGNGYDWSSIAPGA